MKDKQIQKVEPRQPRQERARYKVELILEASIRLLEKHGPDGLTTNAIAAAAGVSIGTLYQYFANKEAILDALADREVGGMAGRVMTVMEDPAIVTAEARVAAIVGAFAQSYGQRRAAHRLIMAHSLARGGNRLAPLLQGLRAHLSTERESGAFKDAMTDADAFVLANAFAGVLRAMVMGGEEAPPQDEIERALSRLVVSFLR